MPVFTGFGSQELFSFLKPEEISVDEDLLQIMKSSLRLTLTLQIWIKNLQVMRSKLNAYFASLDKLYYTESIKNLESRWSKRIELLEGYVEK